MEQQTGTKLGKEYIMAIYCYPAYLTYTQSTPYKMYYGVCIEYVQNVCILAGLDEAQAGIKNARSNINNLRYADVWHHSCGRKQRLKNLLMKVKEESRKADLKLTIQKMKIMASGPITSWEIDGETVADFIFLSSKIPADGDCSHEIKRRLLLGRKVMSNLDSIFKSSWIRLSDWTELNWTNIFISSNILINEDSQ